MAFWPVERESNPCQDGVSFSGAVFSSIFVVEGSSSSSIFMNRSSPPCINLSAETGTVHTA